MQLYSTQEQEGGGVIRVCVYVCVCVQTAADVDRLAEEEGVTTIYCLQVRYRTVYVCVCVCVCVSLCTLLNHMHTFVHTRTCDPTSEHLNALVPGCV